MLNEILMGKKIYNIIISLYIFGSFAVPMLGVNEALVQIPMYLFLFLCLIGIATRRMWVDQSFALWYGLFFLFCLLSVFYSVDRGYSSEVLMDIISAFIFAICLNSFFHMEGSIAVVKKSYIVTSIIVGLPLIGNFSQDHWWSRLGESFGMNENMVGLFFLIPLCFAITELTQKRKKTVQIIDIVSIVICGYIVALSGSKKAIFAIVIFGALFYLARSDNMLSKLKVILITIILVFIAYNILIKVPLLYNIAGKRIESMVSVLLVKNYSSTGSSTSERGDMIRFGLNCFAHSPLLGNGINGFKKIYGLSTGHYVYAHNNYVELLADLGIIGIVSYYSIYYKIIRKVTWKVAPIRKQNAEIIGFLGVLLFYDIAMVSYYDTRIIMLIACIFVMSRKNTETLRTRGEDS